MPDFLHWRKVTWAFVLWSGYVLAWAVITGSGPTIAAPWWFAGMIALSSLWVATQPQLREGRGLDGFLVWPIWTTGVWSTSIGLRSPGGMPAEAAQQRSRGFESVRGFGMGSMEEVLGGLLCRRGRRPRT